MTRKSLHDVSRQTSSDHDNGHTSAKFESRYYYELAAQKSCRIRPSALWRCSGCQSGKVRLTLLHKIGQFQSAAADKFRLDRDLCEAFFHGRRGRGNLSVDGQIER